MTSLDDQYAIIIGAAVAIFSLVVIVVLVLGRGRAKSVIGRGRETRDSADQLRLRIPPRYVVAVDPRSATAVFVGRGTIESPYFQRVFELWVDGSTLELTPEPLLAKRVAAYAIPRDSIHHAEMEGGDALFIVDEINVVLHRYTGVPVDEIWTLDAHQLHTATSVLGVSPLQIVPIPPPSPWPALRWWAVVAAASGLVMAIVSVALGVGLVVGASIATIATVALLRRQARHGIALTRPTSRLSVLFVVVRSTIAYLVLGLVVYLVGRERGWADVSAGILFALPSSFVLTFALSTPASRPGGEVRSNDERA